MTDKSYFRTLVKFGSSALQKNDGILVFENRLTSSYKFGAKRQPRDKKEDKCGTSESNKKFRKSIARLRYYAVSSDPKSKALEVLKDNL
jgi:hypothetical protein